MNGDEIRVGSIYEDCAFHPVLCTGVDEVERDIEGISLIDGSAPRSCSLDHCGPVSLSIELRAHLDKYVALRVEGVAVEEAIGQLPVIA